MGNCSMRAITDTSPEYPLSKTTFEGFAGKADSKWRKSTVEVLPPPRDGVWKVRLVIDQKDLSLILSEDVNTEALIERMRYAANSTPVRGKSSSSWGETVSYKCARLSDQPMHIGRSHF
ncbi:Unknown protein [Striga hermonthica]|uniref:Uncharacterized protein n=1 Tax=Striga hermonthica TaxID=68872 RepID=A0A9N7RMR6_STRHE|nr:Unknown protein [Striga hermonthica]